MHENAEFSSTCTFLGYRLVPCYSTKNHVGNTDTEFTWDCRIHGSGCMGHLETDKNRSVTLLPSSFIHKKNDMPNRYQRFKNVICN